MPKQTRRDDDNERDEPTLRPTGPLAAVGGVLGTSLILAALALLVARGRRRPVERRRPSLGILAIPASIALAALAAIVGVADTERRGRLVGAAGEAAAAVAGAARSVAGRVDDHDSAVMPGGSARNGAGTDRSLPAGEPVTA